ncbi:MAG TPA: molybdopterin-dependent oxidoreductase, partial [Bacteroidota bacterium]|nr:molybdopterin-dependent oxidoreductase [Bacteroidota bacterium]
MGQVEHTETLFRERRRFLRLSPLLLLAGCDYSAGRRTESVLRSFQEFNDWVQSKVFDPAKLAPEYSDAQLTPEDGFRVNGYDTDEPEIDIENWKLSIEGLVSKPGKYDLQQITALPKQVKNLRHCCVEGWSMIPKWGGAR